MTAHLAAGLDVNGIWYAIQSFMGDYHKIFPGLADLCKTARVPFMSVAALLLMAAFGMRVAQSRSLEQQALHVIKAMVFVAVVCLSPQLLLKTSQAFLELSGQVSKVTLDGLNQQADNLLADYLGAKAAKGGATGQGSSDLQNGSNKADWGWFQFMNPDAIGQKFNEGWAAVQALVLQVFQVLVTIFFKGCLFIAMCIELAQYLYLQISSIFLPCYVAMIALGASSGMGLRYVMGLVGVCAWPVAWGLAGLGTQGMINAVSVNVGDPSKGPMEYIWIGVLLCAIPAWIVFMYIAGPFLLQRTAATGSNAVGGMMAGTAGMAAGGAALGAGVLTSGVASVIGGVANGLGSLGRALGGGSGSKAAGSTSTVGAATGGVHRTAVSSAAGGKSVPSGKGSNPVTAAAQAAASRANAAYFQAAKAAGSFADQAAHAEGSPAHGRSNAEMLAAQIVAKRQNTTNRPKK
jgi:hypothetical protein